jgi:hypothetical protein
VILHNVNCNIKHQIIKGDWHNHESTCIDVSSSDVLQFAAFFAVVRQSGVPGLTPAKRDILIGNAAAPGNINFKWGRPDADVADCDVGLASNLPQFSPSGVLSIVTRCIASGGEIKEKMMNRWFTIRVTSLDIISFLSPLYFILHTLHISFRNGFTASK